MYIAKYEADHAYCGTLHALKELEKLGLFTIIEVQNFAINDEWSESEGYEEYSESFIIRIADKENNVNSCGYDFVTNIIGSLVDYVECEFIKDGVQV